MREFHESVSIRRPLMRLQALVVLGCVLALASRPAPAQDNRGQADRFLETHRSIPWQAGPTTVSLGDVAELQVPPGFQFVGSEGAARWLEVTGNPPDAGAVGVLKEARGTWWMLFSYLELGYVPEDEQHQLDADALLKWIRDSTAQGNIWRRQQGAPALTIGGWIIPPEYDEVTKSLVWATHGTSSHGEKSANYDTRVLGRHGVMSAILVAGPDEMYATIPTVKGLLSGLRFKAGERHSEFKAGDKVAAYGLTGLITGGAAVAAAKVGLLQKFGKLIAAAIAGLVALWAGIRKFARGTAGAGSDKQVGRGQP